MCVLFDLGWESLQYRRNKHNYHLLQNHSWSYMYTHIFALRIRISDILFWDRKSYLTHVLLPRLSHEDGCIGTLAHGCQVIAVNVKSKLRHHLILYFSVFVTSGSRCQIRSATCWKLIICERVGSIEKSAPRDHRLSSLGKTCDAKRKSPERLFLSHTHTHDGFL